MSENADALLEIIKRFARAREASVFAVLILLGVLAYLALGGRLSCR